MPIKHADFIIKGMFRDLSEHAFNPEFAYENQNLRITAEPNSSSNHTGDMYALTNEKGNKYVPIWGLDSTGHNRMNGDKQIFNDTGDMWGVPVGQALLNDKWVVFMIDRDKDIFIDGVEREIEDFPIQITQIQNLKVDSNDRIYKLWFNNEKMYGTLLYEGHLNLSSNFPLETLPYYENSQIQKVYWTDGLNQPRYINIEATDAERDKWTDTSFDFVSTIELLNHKVTITENTTSGMFPAGVVQWYFTYGKQFGPESNIFTQTGLYELKHPNRGAAPDETTTQSFTIKLTGLDYEHFDSVNIYSVIRTSINGVPNCKLVSTLPLTSTSIEYIDTNLTGEAIDPTSLFYKGGEPITAYTFEQKENTLFLGNYSITRPYISDSIRDSLRNFAFYGTPNRSDNTGRYLKVTKGTGFKFTNGTEIWGTDQDDYLNYIDNRAKFVKNGNNVSDNEVPNIQDSTYFKNNNIYRVGIQFQHYTGRWSEVVWLGDYTCTDKYNILENSGLDNTSYRTIPLGYLKMTNQIKSVLETLTNAGYRMVRPVIVYPNITERVVLGQGLLCNTLHSNIEPDKFYPDYFFRTYNNNNIKSKLYSRKSIYRNNLQCYEHWYNGNSLFDFLDSTKNWNDDKFSLKEVTLYQNGNICNIYSPDVEFDDSVQVYNFNNVFLSKTGDVSILNKFVINEIQTSTISKAAAGWYEEDLKKKNVFPGFPVQLVSVVDLMQNNDYYPVSLTDPVKQNNDYKYISSDPDNFHCVRTYKVFDNYVINTTNKNRYLGEEALLTNKVVNKVNLSGYSEHYVGGFIWKDSLVNLAKVTSEALGGIEVPTTAASLLSRIFNWYYPLYIWQHSGSICYDMDTDAASVLKSNKTLHYFTSTVTESNTNDVINLEDCKLNTNEALIKLQNNNKECYGLNYVNTSLVTTKREDVIGVSKFHPNGVDDDFYNSPDFTYEMYWNVYYYKTSFFKYLAHKDEHGYTHPIMNLKTDIKNYTDVYDVRPEWEKVVFDWTHKTESFNTGSFITQVRYKSVSNLIAGINIPSVNYNSKSYIEYTNNLNIDDCSVEDKLVLVDILQSVETSHIFGGYTDIVLQSNSFLPCGDTVPICHYEYNQETEKMELVPNTNIEIVWDKGDIHRQHYECLKTYPYTLEDENSVTEVLDVELETYYNLNGRYDTWKGNPQLSTMPSNFNLMNPVYNQKDNFMVYHGLDLSKFSVSNFPNSFTWTLTKNAGDEIDKWTQITLANTLDVDMNRGQITKIIGLQDNLLCFQPKGISQILYNEREQISTASGVPIEIGNSGKVNGTRYLSVLAGCNNKWSMCKSEKGLYWVDDVNKQIMNFTTQVTNLSDTLGFHSWINDMASLNIWNPLGFNNFVSYFDPYNEDVVFYYKTNALSFSEQLNCFDTFLPYRFVPYYMAFHNSAFTLSDRDSDGKNTYKVWEHFKGDYNYFYVLDECVYDGANLACKGKYDNLGKPTDFGYEPYFTTILVNPDMPYDKVFNNLDTRTDMWAKDINGNYSQLLEETFSHIEVWNEFQWNKSYLVRQLDLPKIHYPAQHSILKKKFRVWYVNIPRDIKQDNPRARYYNRDRFRNTWTYIKLSKELVNNDSLIDYPYISDNKHVIHHVGVSYFI